MGQVLRDAVSADVLGGSVWECRSQAPGAEPSAPERNGDDAAWLPAVVPGTAAAALRALGEWTWGEDDHDRLDGSDWWFRCRFDQPEGHTEGPWHLEIDGLATVADVWLNDEHLLHSENMWETHRVEIDRLSAHNELLLHFAALEPLLAQRRPRPRWRSLLLRSQNQRWFRTTLLGRVPGWAPSGAPVGPWRPIRLLPGGRPAVVERSVVATLDGADGLVELRLRLEGAGAATKAEVRVGEQHQEVAVVEEGDDHVVTTTITVPDVARWWPHTHGDQPLYTLGLRINDVDIDLGHVGFSSIAVDRSEGAFTFTVNDSAIFCRGALWVPPDVVTLRASEGELRRSLQLLVDAGMNMVRIGGYMSYEDSVFWDLCDELGILVWQDCMLAGFDPPEEPEYVESVQVEVRQQLGLLQGRPSLALVCGSSETHQQAAMYGLSSDRWQSTLLEETIPALVDAVVPGVPFVVSSPTGGDLPFEPGHGVAHYFGVGAYLRPLSDARLAGVRFAAECLAFGNPPEQGTVERCFGGSGVAGHDPAWKAGVARDTGTSWDFEDVRDHYVGQVFGVNPFSVRYADPDLYLDYGRATVAHLMATVLAEWRCAQSACAGALVLSWQDIRPGAGWGLLDSFTAPKAPWYALRRTLAPVAVLITDEGLAGLRIHVLNDGQATVTGQLQLTLYNMSGVQVEEAACAVEVDGRSEQQWNAATLLEGFRDVTNAYRFGPPTYDVIRARLEYDGVVSEDFYLPAGSGRPREPDLGLEARAAQVGDAWHLSIRTRRFAQWVALEVPGFTPEDSWFHVAPESERTVALRRLEGGVSPKGRVRALNGLYSSPIIVETN